MNKRFIEFSGPDILDVDIQSVNDVLKSGWLAHGKYSKKLEDLFSIDSMEPHQQPF